MSFVKNDYQQMSFDDPYFSLTEREQKMLDRSWATQFADHIFPLIDEERFSVLYSDKASRPNTPVNVLVGALILKELRKQTDDEIFESLLFDVRYQRALHTTSFKEQPMSDTSLKRFRNRCLTYEMEHGVDLIHECITELSSEMAKLMNISGQIQRMDSMMVASNIKRLSRMELLYTCLSNFVIYLHKHGHDDKLSGLEHYYDPNDMNAVIYHKREDPEEDRLQTILNDADGLLKACEGSFDEVAQYQLLIRVIREQTIRNEDGTLRLKKRTDGGMDSTFLQNPADPEATFREKAGKKNRGYAANITEDVGDRFAGVALKQAGHQTEDHRHARQFGIAAGNQQAVFLRQVLSRGGNDLDLDAQLSCRTSMVHRPLRKGMFSRSEPQIVMVTGSSADAAAIKVSGSRAAARSSARKRVKCFMVFPPFFVWKSIRTPPPGAGPKLFTPLRSRS